MEDIFDYDVFLSFASADEAIVRPIWQELCLSGLRVFWSDTTLKQKLGESWYENIEKSLEKSRHMLLIASQASMSSPWVQREFRAFMRMQGKYTPGSRRLIPLVAGGYSVSQLPLFLQELEAIRFEDIDSLKSLIRLVGGTDVEELKRSLHQREQENKELSEKLQTITSDLTSLTRQLDALRTENARLGAQQRAHADPDPLTLQEGDAAKPNAGSGSSLWSRAKSVVNTLVAPSEAELRAIVDKSIAETSVSGWSDVNSVLVGRKLYSLCKGTEIPVLCSYLEEPEHKWDERLKAYYLLKFSSAQRVSPELGAQALQTFCVTFASGSDGYGNVAAEAIKQMPLKPSTKWEALFDVVYSATANGGFRVIECLTMFTPPDKRLVTGEAVCEVLTIASDSNLIGACVNNLKTFNYRTGINSIRDAMSTGGSVKKAALTASLLADWSDTESLVDMKGVIEQWRYSEQDMYSFQQLLEAYFRLGGSNVASYVQVVLQDAPSGLQNSILNVVASRMQSAEIMRGVSHVAHHSSSPDTRKAAENLLARYQKQ